MFYFTILVSLALVSFSDNCEDCGTTLILTPLIEAGDIKRAKELSKVSQRTFGCNTNSYSGYLTVDKTYNSNLFFWFFKSKDSKAPILLWLEGGPGTSFSLALFMANGPFKISKKLTLNCRYSSWTKKFSVLYIDQPIGTGFSFTDNEKGFSNNLNESTEHLLNALKQFFILFKELRNNEFYATGESYAGKYVPAIAHRVHIDQSAHINLKGIAIGNAFVDPYSCLEYSEFLYEISLIDEQQRLIFEEKEKEIKNLMKAHRYTEAFHKADRLIYNALYSGKTLFTNFTGYENVNNFLRVKDADFSEIDIFLNKPNVMRDLHVGNRSYNGMLERNIPVVARIVNDFLRSAKDMFVVVMNHYKVLLYSGNLDIIVAPVLNNKFLNQLKWKHSDAYLNADREIWKIRKEGKVAGYIKKAYDFYEVIIRNAGHDVEIDKPQLVLEMITKFVNNDI